MSTDDLHDLLDRASDHLPEVDLAERAWAQAHTRRLRNRRAALGLVAACGVAAVVVTTAINNPRPQSAAPAATSSHTSSAPSPTAPGDVALDRVWTLPNPQDMDTLPWGGSGPVQGEIDLLKSAVPFSQSGGFRDGEVIEAAFTALAPDNPRVGVVTSLGNIYLLDELRVESTADLGGNRAFNLDRAAISPDGSLLAIAQPRGVIVVTAGDPGRSPAWRTIAIADPNIESANLVDDGRTILAASENGVYAVDVASGDITERPASFGASAVQATLTKTPTGGSLELRSWDPARDDYGSARTLEVPFDEVWSYGGGNAAGPNWLTALVTPAQRLLDRLSSERGVSAYQGIGAVPLAGGETGLLLDVSGPTAADPNGRQMRSKGGIAPLGFAADGTALVLAGGNYEEVTKGEMRLARQDLLAWNPQTGELARLAALVGDPVDLVLRPGA